MKFKVSLILLLSLAVTNYCAEYLPAAEIDQLIQAIDSNDVALVELILPAITAASGIGGSTDLQALLIYLQNRTQNREIQDLLQLESDINNAEWMIVGEVPIPDLPQTPVRDPNDFSWMFGVAPERKFDVSLADLITELSKLELGQNNLHRLDKAIGWFVRGGGQLPSYIRDRISKARSRATSQGAGGAAGPA